MARTKGSITRCGHCYEEGHNKRTCPELKKEIENNPEGYYARRAKRKKANAKSRRCSYCGEVGHNRATCNQLKCDKTEYQHMNWKFQNRLSSAMREAGLYVGAMLKQEHWGEHRYWLVTGFNMDKINYANFYRSGMGNPKCEGSPYALKVRRVDIGSLSERERGRNYNIDTEIYLPKSILEKAMAGESGNASRNAEVVGPVVPPKSYGFDRYSGMDFLTHEDYKNGYATRYVEGMKKKIVEIEKA